MKLTVVILTKNEELNIADCIKAVKFADEILVIDDNSNDQTVNIANKLGAKVIKRFLNENYASQKNFALKEAKNDWVLFVDADERITKELENEIKNALTESRYSAFRFRRIDLFLGKWLKYGEIGAYRDIRLMKKDSGKWVRRVHESFETEVRVGNLKSPLRHYSHQSLGNLIESTNRWSDWHAKANREEKKHSSVIKILFWPELKFINNYILRLGFLDGLQGFVFAIFMNFHSYLAWSNLWLLQKKK